MPSKGASPRVVIFSLLFLVLFLLLYQKTIRKAINFQEKKLATYKDNFFVSGNPDVAKRTRPITTALLESKLEVNIGAPFNGFKDEEWQSFWEIIFGFSPLMEPAEPGLPKRMRQLTEGEIISELVKLYPRPFANFRQKQWQGFFSLILEE